MTREDVLKLQTYKLFENSEELYVSRDDVLKALQTEHCDDCISRREALLPYAKLRDDDVISVRTIRENLECLSTVQPAQVIMCKDCLVCGCLFKSVDGLIEKLKEKSYSESEYGVDEFDASNVIQLSDVIEVIKDYCGAESEE